MKGNYMLAIFAISALLISISATNFAYAGDSSDDEDRNEKIKKDKELKKEQHKEKIEQLKQDKKELRDEYKIKLEEKKKIFVDYKKELKEKYSDLKNEFKEKYAQLRISTISDVDEDSEDEIESKIKRNELKLLKHEFREHIKNLKLESKQYFKELKHELKAEETDRKNKIHDRINELKEKYKNNIREHDHPSTSDFDSFPLDYESKKIEICHVPPGNPDNAHTLSISVNAMRAHMAHGDYMDECTENGTDETEEEFELTVRAETLGDKSEVKVKLEFLTENIDQGLIIDEIIENFALTYEEADKALKIEEEDDNELEEKFEVEIEIENEYSEVEIELRFVLDTIDREMIIDAIVQKTQLTTEQIKGILEGEPVDENDEGQTIVIELKEELGISQNEP
jgi:hypothetical protein